jgi:carbamoyltransferase
MLAFGNGNGIRKLETVNVPHSLGHLYAAVTDHLGFEPFFDEWKVMGLSAYGTDKLEKEFRNVVDLLPAGNFRLNLDFFEFHTKGRRAWTSPHFTDTFGPKRHFDGTYTQHHYDLAYALQKTVEDAGTHIAKRLYDLTHSDNLCLTGGVALNVLMNRAIIEQTEFKNIFIQPIANDAGTSLGSALYHYHVKLNGSRKFIFDNVYWGPEYSNQEIEAALKEAGVRYKKVDNIAQQTAQHIADSRIVGWFQGRMESGPRALGNRSITVNPTDQNMKDILNARVKKREFFRPFAPSILEEKVSEFFEMPKNLLSPYMVLVGNVKEEKRRLIPAVTHADNTARVHTVSRETNPRYWQLINEFYKLTGVPVLLNTSFNENEPIVCTPRHAIDCFLRTDFDVLAIGDFIIEK